MHVTADLLLVVAGVIAGVLGSAGGITSLVSYPALLAVGINPLPANVTNAVALTAILPGAALGSRRELTGQIEWIRRWWPVSVVGAAVGATLLLVTPDRLFDRLVPFLVLTASVVLVAQPTLAKWHGGRGERFQSALLRLGLFGIALYCGYFGAGSGVMALALILVTVSDRYPIANALKNVFLGVADVVCALAFVLFGPVHFADAAWLAIGLFVGSSWGPAVARRLPARAMRLGVATLGLGLAVWLWARPT